METGDAYENYRRILLRKRERLEEIKRHYSARADVEVYFTGIFPTWKFLET